MTAGAGARGTASPLLVAVCTGRRERRGVRGSANPLERPWESAIFKTAVAGPVRVLATRLDGDEQADQRVHGGAEKAVLAYGAGHYPAWREELALPDLTFGAFGENLAIAGLDESSVAVGDVLAVGSARLRVSQPRGPCAKLARRFGRADIVERVLTTRRTGFYLRVVEQGVVAAGQQVAVVDRPFATLPIALVLRVLHEKPFDRDAAERLAACPALAPDLRSYLAAKLA